MFSGDSLRRKPIFHDSGNHDASDRKGSGDSGSEGEKKDDFIKEKSSETREHVNKVKLEIKRTRLMKRIKGINDRVKELEGKRNNVQAKGEKLVDDIMEDATIDYKELSAGEKDKYDKKEKDFEEARNSFNQKVYSINNDIDPLVNDINAYNDSVQAHMKTLRDEGNTVNKISQEDLLKPLEPRDPVKWQSLWDAKRDALQAD